LAIIGFTATSGEADETLPGQNTMTQTTWLPVAAVVLVCLLPGRATSDDSAALLARFRAEAPQGWARLEKYDDELTYTATMTWTNTYFKDNKKDVRKTKLTWVRRPGCLRLEKTDLDGKNEGRTTVAVHTDIHLFEVRRARDGGTAWQLLHAGEIKQKTDLLHLVTNAAITIRPTTSFDDGKYYHLPEIEGDSMITFEKARAEDDGIRIDCRTAGRGPLFNKPFETRGFIVFDPRNHWAVQSYQFISSDGSKVGSINTFAEPDRQGIRRVASKRYETWAPHGSVLLEFTYESKKTGPAPPERFRLADFGLPDPLGPLPSRFPTAYVLAGAALVCGVIAMWFRRRAHLARETMTPGSIR
jgi:hypothetical protein